MTSTAVNQVRAARTLFISMAVLMVGLGLANSLTGVRASLEGFSSAAIGLIGAAYYIGLLPGSLVTPSIVGRVGHIRVFAGLASLAAASVVTLPAAVAVAPWVAIRVILGFCMAGLYVTAESWLNSVSTNKTRGRMLAVYLLVVNLAIGFSQYLLTLTDPKTVTAFAFAGILFSLSVVPLTLSTAPQPAYAFEKQRVPLREIAKLVPMGTATAAVNGLVNGTLVAFGAAYATSAGMSLSETGTFIGAAFIGGLILQFPLGWISDHYPRRKVILVTTIVAGVAATAGAFVEPTSRLMPVVMLVYAAVAFPMYSMGISHVQDQVPSHLMIPASAALLAFYGVGAIAGPLVTAVAVGMAGPVAFWWSLAVAHFLLAPFAVWRLVRRAVMPRPQRASNPLPAEAGSYFGLLVDHDEPPSPLD